MTIFTKAVNDIFNDGNFLEHCLIGETVYDCICSAVEDGIIYGDAGAVSDVDFILSLKLPLKRMPKQGDEVKFRGSHYKVSSTEVDSAAASLTLRLESMSKG